jgi:hypothetical protein
MGTHAVRGVGLAKAFAAMALASGMVLAVAWTEASATLSGSARLHAATSSGASRGAVQRAHARRLLDLSGPRAASGQNLIAIGLNPHGVPGIYFTQKL